MVSEHVETIANDLELQHHHSMVICLDDTSQDRRFYRNSHLPSSSSQNGTVTSLPDVNEPINGLLSKEDIELLLSIFHTGKDIFFSLYSFPFLSFIFTI